MKRLLICALLFAALALQACTSYNLMSPTNFKTIAAGNPISTVEDMYGPAYDVTPLPNGNEEYRYIQRIDINASTTECIEYIFIVRNGRIIAKQERQTGSLFNCQWQ